MVESAILEKRAQRLKEEEDAMVKEVVAHGNVVGVGGIDPKDLAKLSKNNGNMKNNGSNYGGRSGGVGLETLEINPDTYDPQNPTKRPSGNL